MNKLEFKNRLQNKVLILDGATGTELQKRGLPTGVSPESWVIEHPETLIDLQKNYIQSGSNVVYTFTFGGNRIKLAEYGLGDRVIEYNRRLAEISKAAVASARTGEEKALVAGNISATGEFIRPFGSLPFEDAVNTYKEQVKGLLLGGVDFFVIETMIDIQEARAALLAVKESSDLPVCVSMTFNEDGRTLTGSDPVTALITLQSMGADVVGCNCSTGPEKMLDFIKHMKPYANVPLLAKPNAGLPKLIDGKTLFDMEPMEFGRFGPLFVEQGINIIGGCCGTSPEYIRELSSKIQELKPVVAEQTSYSAITSVRKTVFIGQENPLTIVGERINPTGKKTLQSELREGKTGEVRRLAMEQMSKGATILDVNVGMPGIDEKETMINVVELLSATVEAPLCLDSSTAEVLEAALRIYPGRALINSISAEKVKLEKLLPVAAKYGAMFIVLPLNDAGIPATASERQDLVRHIYNEAITLGYRKNDLVVDGLVMTVSSDQRAALETLVLINWCSVEFKVNTIIGLSNVSFGLPERIWVNGAFLAMAIGKGLTMAIANPSSETLLQIKLASDVLVSKDGYSKNYIHYFSLKENSDLKTSDQSINRNVLEQVFSAVVEGNKDVIKKLIEQALHEGNQAQELMNQQLIPAITRVGELFEKKQYFLPQLIQSAETMKQAFECLEPYLKTDPNGSDEQINIVLATVKGDIHDIGKNIVALMLRNYGFKVWDLGKDVCARSIIEKAKEVQAKIIGLSALMTTTMVEMKHVITLVKEENLNCKCIIGGAVVNQAYADEIGANGYSGDAQSAVKLVQKLLST